MKIGVLLSRVPYPLEKGDKLRAYHQIKTLSQTHDIYLCALNVGKIHPDAIKQLRPYCQEIKIIQLTKIGILLNLVYSLVFTNLPLQVAYFYNRRAKKHIHRFFETHKIEHLYCQLIRTSEYVKDYHAAPKTLDYMDALSRGMERRINQAKFGMRQLIQIETTRLKRYEHFIFSSFEHKTIISEQDRNLIVHAQNHHIHIIRNGVDQQYFKPQSLEKKFDLLFTGNMSYPPNVDGVEYLVNQILPLVWQINPEVTLAIAGATPSQRVESLASEKVVVTGWVDDIREYYASSKIFIAPMQIGTGLQNKLLEAMAMKVPCITSPLANNALGGEHHKNILIGETAIEFKDEIIELLKNQKKAVELAQNGYEFISKHYDWRSSTSKLEALFLDSKRDKL